MGPFFLLYVNISHTSLNIPTAVMEQVALLKQYYAVCMRADSTSVLLSRLIHYGSDFRIGAFLNLEHRHQAIFTHVKVTKLTSALNVLLIKTATAQLAEVNVILSEM